VQFQKIDTLDPDSMDQGSYVVDVRIFDAKKPPNMIGQTYQKHLHGGTCVWVDGLLPHALGVCTNKDSKDHDPLQVRYDGQEFNTSSEQCGYATSGGVGVPHGWHGNIPKAWGYDSGSRNIDCGFTIA